MISDAVFLSPEFTVFIINVLRDEECANDLDDCACIFVSGLKVSRIAYFCEYYVRKNCNKL